MALFRRKKAAQAPPATHNPHHPFSLDSPLVWLTNNDPWRVRDACEGTQIFGGTGSGKTSGSGQAIAKAFLTSGFGGLVCTAKPDDRELWERYAAETGRSDSVIVFSPHQDRWRFNFLDYELRRPGGGAGQTENLVNLFMTVLEAVEGGQGGGSNEQFWDRTLKQLLRNAIDLARMARNTVSLPLLYDIISTAPQSIKQSNSEAWQKRSTCFQCLTEADATEKDEWAQHDFDLTARFWLNEFPNLAPRTRSTIVTSFTSMADMFLRGTLRKLFCSTLTLLPELTHGGAIIIVDLPIKEYHALGKVAQILVKYLWQRATERRDVATNPRPVFLWADEAQFFLTSHDQQFQTTARSSRACTVYLTQNLPNYIEALGGDTAAQNTAESFLGNLQTKIFHANGDKTTNQYAADSIAKSWQQRSTSGTSGGVQGMSVNRSQSEAFEYTVAPREFTMLRKGGAANNLEVDAIIFQGGRVWQQNQSTHLYTTFRQDG